MFETALMVVSILFVLTFFYVIIKKYRQDYILLIFELSIMFMINLDGISFNSGIFKSMDILITAVMMVIFVMTLLKIKTKLIPQFLIYMIFLLNSIISSFMSPVVMESSKFLLRQAFFLVLIIIIMNYKMTLKSINKLLKLWFVFSLVPAIIAIFQVVTSNGIKIIEDVGNSNLTRGFGLTSHPNFLAYYLMMLLIIFSILIFEKKISFNPILFLLFSAIQFIALLLTFSRGALIGLMIGLGLYFFIKKPKQLIYIPLIIFVVLMVPGVSARFIELFDIETLLGDSSFAWRLANWAKIINIIDGKTIIFGNGFKSIVYYVNYAPHNEYIGFLFESGILGTLTFYTFIMSLFFIFKKAYKKNDVHGSYYLVGMILIVVSLIMSLTDNYFTVPSSIFYFWYFIGLLLNMIHQQNEVTNHES